MYQTNRPMADLNRNNQTIHTDQHFLIFVCFTGPIALPIIGSVIQVALADRERPFAAFQKLAKKYGNIMGLELGSVYTGTEFCVINVSCSYT